jgi:hypothetical protein
MSDNYGSKRRRFGKLRIGAIVGSAAVVALILILVFSPFSTNAGPHSVQSATPTTRTMSTSESTTSSTAETSTTSSGYNWIPNGVDVSYGIPDSTNARVGVDPSDVYVVWQGQLQPGHTQVFFSASHDNGSTFSTPEDLSNDQGIAQNPQVATRNGNVYVIWQDSSNGLVQLFFTASRDRGNTWSTPQAITGSTGSVDSSTMISVGSSVFIAWSDNSQGHDQVFFLASQDNGTTFASKVSISADAGTATSPRIASQLGYVFIVWEDNSAGHYQILERSSANDGLSFGTATVLSAGSTGDAINPSINGHITPKSSNIYAVWQDDSSGHYQIVFTSSHNDGASWSLPVNLSNDAGSATNPSMTSHGNGIGLDVFVVWQDASSGKSQIMATASYNNGTSFSNPVDVSDNEGAGVSAVSPHVSTRDDSTQTVYIVWENVCTCGGSTTSQAILSISSNNGVSYAASISVSDDPGNTLGAGLNESPSSGENVYMVWADDSSGSYQVVIHVVV